MCIHRSAAPRFSTADGPAFHRRICDRGGSGSSLKAGFLDQGAIKPRPPVAELHLLMKKTGHLSPLIRFRRLSGAALLAAMVCSAPVAPDLLAHPQGAVYRADVDMVLLNVAVVDPGGTEVPALEKADFSVYDNGVRQEIVQFLTPADSALDIGLVLDSSTSMTPVATRARRAALTFLSTLDVDDCVYVLPFTEEVDSGRWGRAGDPVLWSYIDNIVPSGGTSLYDALMGGIAVLERAETEELIALGMRPQSGDTEKRDANDDQAPGASDALSEELRRGSGAASQDPESAFPEAGQRRPISSQLGAAVFEVASESESVARRCGGPLPIPDPADPRSARRRALVVLSDGADENSRASFAQVLTAARATSVPVFPLALGYANEDQNLKARLGELARATGGRLIESARPEALQASYGEIVELLRSSYLLGYYPSAASSQAASDRRPAGQIAGDQALGLRWHEVSVVLRRPNFRALVRPGYYR